MAPKRAEHSLVIEAEPAVCFDAITQYETFPEWQGAVKEVEVLSRDGEGRGLDVRFDIDA
jgi:ribosome-associated toxin RatA of RatAB toxin-antitoxin module